MRYHLSSGQRRDIERGTEISVVLPARAETPTLAGVQPLLDVPDDWVRGVESIDLWVSPLLAGTRDGLVGCLGQILPGPPRREQVAYQVRCWRVTLASRQPPAARRAELRWPYAVTLETSQGRQTFPAQLLET